MADFPRIPRAREARIPTEKLVSYALDPEHPRGQHKARVFASGLGIRQADWQYLRDQLLAGVVDAPVRGTRITPFGVLSRDQLRQSHVMSAPRHSVLDVVALRIESGRWPAGTVGTVVEADDARVLIEVDDDRGHALDFLSLPHDALASTGERSSRAAS